MADNWLERLERTMEKEKKKIKDMELALFCTDIANQCRHIYTLQQLAKNAQDGSVRAKNALLNLSGRPWEKEGVL